MVILWYYNGIIIGRRREEHRKMNIETRVAITNHLLCKYLSKEKENSHIAQ
jgi:hypothetical protein